MDHADGLGAASREKLAARGVSVIADLLWTLPFAWDDLSRPLTVAEAIERARANDDSLAAAAPRICVRGVITSASLVSMRGRRSVRVVLAQAGAEGGAAGACAAKRPSLDAWWFYAAHGILASAKPGTACLLVGRIRSGRKRASMAHPDLVPADLALPASGPSGRPVSQCTPRYASMGLPVGTLRRAIRDALQRTAPPPDPVPARVVAREGMPEAGPLLRVVHGSPHGTASGLPPEAARRALGERLAWAEAFTRVWQRLGAEESSAPWRAPVLAVDASSAARFVGALGFALTDAQRRAMGEIALDLASPVPMRRLLLGDVGTGKTVVALAAAAQCVAAGHQCALLAPTGLLAEQTLGWAAFLAVTFGVRCEHVAAGMPAARRRDALAGIASGQAGVVIGTHALLERDVVFARLGLVVVDEQQRLGVAQRLTMVRKGEGTRPHLLSLSATPIPRTLALALRGELSVSVLDERPPGRVTVATELCPRSRLERAVDAIRAATARGESAFFVCPHIEDDDAAGQEAVGVVARAEALASAVAPARVEVVHGSMSAADRTAAMRAFRVGKSQVLVGTTVIEVGIDVPLAALIVIDGAERFGLAQLHQLRGRVGRGTVPGRCILVHDEPLGGAARARLETIARTSDGAEIAAADLALRGGGDLGGTRQSGAATDFAWLDAVAPPAWLERLDDDVRAIRASDPLLAAPEHLGLALAVRRFATAIAVREEAD